ncbi:hypothetical protein [Anaerotruncus rubiinfantis]|jgi:hypothetical protein|uniref:hypothetical protein n=1 Tax=Anaerotruncus rubiinfantis TaxID=1720200 RepID=UPI00189B2684|nr:hypothetical protein [Anaerotruncus rubiinfantis]
MADIKNVGTIYADTSSLDRIAEVLEGFPEETEKAVRRVMYRVVDNARAEIVRQIPKAYLISKDMIKSALKKKNRRVRLGAVTENQAAIIISGRPINLVRFPHFPGEPLYGKARFQAYSTVAITRAQGMKNIGGTWKKRFSIRDPQKDPPKIKKTPLEKKNAFLMRTSRKPATEPRIPYFFVRRTGEPSKKNPKKEGVEPLSSVSIPQMVLNPKVANPVIDYVEKQMEKRVQVEVVNALVSLQRKVGA